MLEPHSFSPHPHPRFASGDTKRIEIATRSPLQNHLLAALPAEDYARLARHLESCPLPLGATIFGAGDRQKYAYFPIAGIVSRIYAMENGDTAAFAVTGREGMIGVASYLGANSTTSTAQVLSAGHAFRLRSDILHTEFERCIALSTLLLRYAMALIAQTCQVAACNRHHALEHQLCRWILSCADRLPPGEMTITQEQIAGTLGVRRESVTEAAGRLQQDGLIRYRRGHITLLDRPRMEAQACECYWVVKRECERLLPEHRQAALAA